MILLRDKEKALIIYFSRTGNTQKVASEIAKVLSKKFEVIIKTPERVLTKDLSESKLLIIGTPVHKAAPAKPIKQFLEKLPRLENKKAIIYCTYTLHGDKRTLGIMRKFLEEKGVKVIGKFSVIGAFRIGIITLKKGRPSEEDLRRVRDYVRQIIASL